MPPLISHLDHLVLTVKDINQTVEFYTSVLQMQVEVFAEGRFALKFGAQKINLHLLGAEFEPKANHPTSGAADLCFITTLPLAELMLHVQRCGVEIIEGPVPRTGATSSLLSFYFRDPDGNLIEVANLITDGR